MKKDPVIVIFLILSWLLILIALANVYFGLNDLDDQLILHFNSEGVVDLVGTSREAVNIVVIGAAVLLINFFLVSRLYYRAKILAYFIGGCSLAVSVFVYWSTVLISSLN